MAAGLNEDSDDGLKIYKGPPGVAHNAKTQSTSLSSMTSIVVGQRLGKPEHKQILFWHVVFKVMPDLFYILGGMMGFSFVGTFIITVTLISVDFWFTKNISGRLLAGLRWWSNIDEETGKVVWRYESWSAEERQVSLPFQVRTFWFGMFGQQMFWLLMSVMCLFRLKLSWFLITFVALVLNGSNVVGYMRARFTNTSPQEEPSLLAKINLKMTELMGRVVMSGRHRGGGYTRPDNPPPPTHDETYKPFFSE